MPTAHDFGPASMPHGGDPLDAAFAAMPEPLVPPTLLPRLLHDLPQAQPGSVRPAMSWRMGIVMAAAAACIAVLMTLLKIDSPPLQVSESTGDAIVSSADYTMFADSMSDHLLKDTNPCRILPQQSN